MNFSHMTFTKTHAGETGITGASARQSKKVEKLKFGKANCECNAAFNKVYINVLKGYSIQIRSSAPRRRK